jgi:DtxR family Mn-dependent transcriptional regulator
MARSPLKTGSLFIDKTTINMLTISENAQEILELLWIAEEDGKIGLNEKAVQSEAIEELFQCHLVIRDGLNWRLTNIGRPEASQAIRRHRLGERLLADVLKADDLLLDEQACRLEHVLYDGLDESICTLLGHPQFCPHGKPIPPGRCCRQMRLTVGRLISPLSEMQARQAGQVAYIRMNRSGHLEKLMMMGVLPGGRIVLLRRSPSFVIECGFSQFAIDEEIARDIFVRLNDT